MDESLYGIQHGQTEYDRRARQARADRVLERLSTGLWVAVAVAWVAIAVAVAWGLIWAG